jgi:RNA-directed DNA polymerase
MTAGDADNGAETPRARSEGSGRKPREDGTGASNVTAGSDHSAPEATGEPCAPARTGQLMELIVSRENMMAAYARVVGNKGAAGIDEMTVADLKPFLVEHWPRIREDLLADRYRPQTVRGVEIPKPGGGVRQLGIPTVGDRLIQQAMHQVLTPLFDPGFSPHAYGFRAGRRAHDAVKAARDYVAGGRRFVVDMDLEKFFDRVNHDVLMARVARKVADKRVLRLIRRYLQAGLMQGGIETQRTEGTPQGGPLSPLLSNILLDDLDKELERRGHAFCRYADDCNIYVASKRAGERVMVSVTKFLSERLKLTVNAAKSAVDRPWRRTFLGFSMTAHKEPRLRVAPKSVARFKGKLKDLLRQGRGRNIARTVKDLTPVVRGWIGYFRLAETKGIFEDLDGWVRRKLRGVLWRQWKRPPTRKARLMQRGLTEERARASASNGRGPWWNAGASHMNDAFRAAFFANLGLPSLQTEHRRLNRVS